MRLLLTYTIVLLLSLSAIGQTEPLFSQYMFNKSLYNPGALGSSNGINTTLFYRNQWTGIEGAPKTYSLSVDGAIKEKYALGLNGTIDQLGAVDQYAFYAGYAYRIITKNGTVGLGLQAGMAAYRIQWNELTAVQAGDTEAFNSADDGSIAPNFGAGIYYQNERLSVGLSMPRILNNQINENVEVAEKNHLYLSFDYRSSIIQNKFALLPSTLIKYSPGANAQLDINLRALLFNSFAVGGGYRSDNSFIAMASYSYANANIGTFTVGYAYDVANKDYRSQAGNVHELFLQVVIGKGNKKDMADTPPPTNGEEEK